MFLALSQALEGLDEKYSLALYAFLSKPVNDITASNINNLKDAIVAGIANAPEVEERITVSSMVSLYRFYTASGVTDAAAKFFGTYEKIFAKLQYAPKNIQATVEIIQLVDDLILANGDDIPNKYDIFKRKVSDKANIQRLVRIAAIRRVLDEFLALNNYAISVNIIRELTTMLSTEVDNYSEAMLITKETFPKK